MRIKQKQSVLLDSNEVETHSILSSDDSNRVGNFKKFCDCMMIDCWYFLDCQTYVNDDQTRMLAPVSLLIFILKSFFMLILLIVKHFRAVRMYRFSYSLFIRSCELILTSSALSLFLISMFDLNLTAFINDCLNLENSVIKDAHFDMFKNFILLNQKFPQDL